MICSKMGKAKKLNIAKATRHTPLEEDLTNEFVKIRDRTKVRNRKVKDDEFVDSKLSKKILDQANEQQEEMLEEFGMKPQTSKSKTVQLDVGSEESDNEDFSDNDDSFYENITVNPEDEKALELFMSRDAPIRRTLADIIKEKLTEKETELQTQFSDAGSIHMIDLDEKVVEMYRGVGKVLAHYRSGKIPKAFKIIPVLTNWEQILYLTQPDKWTAAAMYQATRIFAANLKEKMAQRFYNLVLLPRIRDDIIEYKKLNFHLYQALRKSLFKPGAFFKGIILPLCEDGDCTLREAIIISSVISKNSIPILHSSAALLKIAEMNYSGANSIFLRSLLDKKYALPFRVVDGVVHHFLRFCMDKRELPVLWHQAFLTFAQRYKEDISSDQKEALMSVLRVHTHPKIAPEIRRELINSKCRGDEKDEEIDDN